MDFLDFIGPVVGGAADIGNTVLGFQNLAYNKQVQKETWAREDNAVQRRAKDLEAAGINPLLAAGSAAASSSPIQVGTPQISMDNAQAMASMLRQGHENARTDADKALMVQNLNNAKDQNNQIKAITQGVALENESKKLRNDEQSWNLGLAKARGLRTSDTGVAQLAGSIFDAIKHYMPGTAKITGPLLGAASDMAGALGKGISSAANAIKDGKPAFQVPAKPGYHWVGHAMVKDAVDPRSGSRNPNR